MLDLDNGTRIDAPTEAWVLGILNLLQGSPQLEQVVKYVAENETKIEDPAPLVTADGHAVHVMKGIKV